VAYASGDALPGATATALAPGQPTGFAAVPLTTEVVAFAGVGGLAQTSASWSPTIAITIPAGAAAGEYHGTITHSAY
jgi:hypothetical protein